MEYYLWKRKRVTSEQKSIFYIAPSENIYGDYGRSRTWKAGMNGFIAKPLDAEKMFTILKQSIVEN